MLALAFIAVSLSLAGQGGQVVGLALQPAVGLSDEEIAPLAEKISDEIGKKGMMVVHADALDPACVPDPGCVEQTRAALAEAPSALLVVELIRVGPVLQLTATGAAGDVRASGSHGLDDTQLAKGPLLPKEVRAWLTTLADAHAAAAAAPPPPPPAAEPPADTGFELSPMRSGGLFAVGVGAVATAAGIILLSTQESVLGDRNSTGKQKETARALGWVGVGVVVVGVAGLGSGAGLFMLE